MSSAISRVTCARSCRVSGVLSSAIASSTASSTRGSMLASRPSSPPAAKSRGPSRVMTSWWTRDLRSANGSVGAGARSGSACCSRLTGTTGSGLRDWMRSERLNSRRLLVPRLGEPGHARLQDALAAGGCLLCGALTLFLVVAVVALRGGVYALALGARHGGQQELGELAHGL